MQVRSVELSIDAALSEKLKSMARYRLSIFCRGFTFKVLAACFLLMASACSPENAEEARELEPDQEIVRPSAASMELSRFYSRLQSNLLRQGFMRTDGGGLDAYYSHNDILRNFERIALYDEYARNSGGQKDGVTEARLRKWSDPVKIGVEFGDSVSDRQRETDRKVVRNYVERLADITGHPISFDDSPNFHVMFMGLDDRDYAVERILEIVPNINPSSLGFVGTLPRSVHCVVVTFANVGDEFVYRRAIALIRAEHPVLLRRSCIHEEIAQGLGLANDSLRARPSIFNDNYEFALLTKHDEILLRLLYDPSLTPGMSADEVRPVLRELIAGFKTN
ncbi:MAG: DUF2927 domain-containing protein [Roseovarius sp.]|nr:DUF2927 domain-containing protein [Roseovarius sp.]